MRSSPAGTTLGATMVVYFYLLGLALVLAA